MRYIEPPPEAKAKTQYWRLALTSLLILSAALALAAPGDLIICDSTGSEPAQNTPWTKTSYLAADLSFSGWERGSGALAGSGHDNAFGVFVSHHTPMSTLAEAIADGEYISFTLEATADSLDLGGKKIAFSSQRFDWRSPLRFACFSSVDGFAEGDEIFATESLSQGNYDVVQNEFIFPLEGYDGIAGPVELRFYIFEAEYWGNVIALNSFSIVDPGPIYELRLDSTEGGEAHTNPPGTVFEAGTAIQLVALPDSGHHFEGWSGDLNGLGNPRTITIDSDLTISGDFAPDPAPNLRIGTNSAWVEDWSSAWVFVDVFKMTRSWLTRSVGGWEWENYKEDEMAVDSEGWPLQLPFYAPSDGNDHYAHTMMPAPVAGDYTVILEGAGKIQFSGAADTSVLSPAGGGETTYTIHVPDADGGALFLAFRYSASRATHPAVPRGVRRSRSAISKRQILSPSLLTPLRHRSRLTLFACPETGATILAKPAPGQPAPMNRESDL